MDHFLAALDLSLQTARSRMAVAAVVDWDAVLARARARGDGDCAICLCGLDPIHRPCAVLRHAVVHTKPVRLTTSNRSCSHVFHDTCVAALERFCSDAPRTCPICRVQDYTRRPWSAV